MLLLVLINTSGNSCSVTFACGRVCRNAHYGWYPNDCSRHDICGGYTNRSDYPCSSGSNYYCCATLYNLCGVANHHDLWLQQLDRPAQKSWQQREISMQISSCKPLYFSVWLHRPALGVLVPEIYILFVSGISRTVTFLVLIPSTFSASTFAVTDNWLFWLNFDRHWWWWHNICHLMLDVWSGT